MGAASIICCLAVVLILAELRPIDAAPFRLPLRQAETTIRQARADVPQPLTQPGLAFVMDILLGDPQQVMTVEVDTVSSDLLVFGPACPRSLCGGPKFDPTESTTNEPALCPDDTNTYYCAFCVTGTDPLNCAINATDPDGALVTGIVGIDQATIYGLAPAYIFYGQLTGWADASGNPVVTGRGVSGRLGLGYGKDGIFGLQSPLYIIQWVNNLPLSFSLCMTGSEPFIDMGELLATSSIYQWAAGRSPDYYAFLLSDIGITTNPPGGGRLNIVPTLCKIDSLLNGFVFPVSEQANTQAGFSRLCPGIRGICGAPFIWDGPLGLSQSEIANYPSIVLINDEYSSPIVIPPTSYLLPNGDGTVSMGIMFSGDVYAVGLQFLAMYRVGIDLLFPGGYGRIGLADISNCNDRRFTTSDAATLASSTSVTASTSISTRASTTAADVSTTFAAESSATRSSTVSLRASTTQAVIMSSLSTTASGNGPAQASTTATASTTTTAYVAASTLAASTSRTSASTSAATTSAAAAVTTGTAASMTSSLSALSASVTSSTTAAVDSSTNAVTSTNVVSLSAASSTTAATTFEESTTLAATLSVVTRSSTVSTATTSTRASIQSTSAVVSTRTSSTVSATTSLTVASATTNTISTTEVDASVARTTSVAAGPTTTASTATGPSTTVSTVTTNTENHKHQPPISTSEVVAIVVLGLICVLAILALIAVCYHRSKSEGYSALPLPPPGVGSKGYVGMD